MGRDGHFTHASVSINVLFYNERWRGQGVARRSFAFLHWVGCATSRRAGGHHRPGRAPFRLPLRWRACERSKASGHHVAPCKCDARLLSGTTAQLGARRKLCHELAGQPRACWTSQIGPRRKLRHVTTPPPADGPSNKES